MATPRFVSCGIGLGLALWSVSSAVAQCDWHPGGGIPGVIGLPLASAVYDDGHGPALYLAGNISIAEESFVSNIVKWDGDHWTSVGGGVTGAFVHDLVVFNGELIAAGTFTEAGGQPVNNIARWNGSWQPLGSGITNTSALPQVEALAVYNGELIAGGFFDTAGGQAAANIARWNGSSWAPLGIGVTPGVHDLTVYNGELVAGGILTEAGGLSVSNIARWNGANWAPLGPGLDSIVFSLETYAGELIAAGNFLNAGSQRVSRIARWNGSLWAPLGAGVGAAGVSLRALGVYNGQLIVSGQFPSQGGTILTWNGTTWGALDSVGGVGYPSYPYVETFCVHENELIAAGRFTTAGDAAAESVARWNGTEWAPLGRGMSGPLGQNAIQADVRAFAVYNNDLIAAGSFLASGESDVRYIARWDGEFWQPLGPAPNEPLLYALAVHNGQLVAGGQLSSIGGVAATNIARWDGTAWAPFGLGIGTRFSTVHALTVYNGDLIAGGGFTQADGMPANRIARWDGASWQPVGNGITGQMVDVYALAVFQGDLIAGGYFLMANGAPGNCVARWNGSSWQAMQGGLSARVRALAVFNNELFAAGWFPELNYIARWNGNWTHVGSGLNGFANALLVHEDTLIVGGTFDTAGGQPANGIAGWDGASWGPFSTGVGSGGVSSLASWGDDFIAGGTFLTAGGELSKCWARWSCTAPCPEDCNGDGQRDLTDLAMLLSCFGGGACCDSNGDSQTDLADLAALLGVFGEPCR